MPEPAHTPDHASNADSSSEELAPTLARPESGEVPLPFGRTEPAFGPPAHADEVGTFGRYRVLKKLGQGGMGAVYLGYDAALERKIALKVMLPAIAADPESRERFLREARSAAKVKSDHTVVIYEVAQERGIPFIAMEYLLGMPLDQFLKQKGDLPLLHVLRVGREVALGLVAVHELGLVHRDIKPANVWLESPKGRAKLLDFGLARAADDTVHLTGTGMVVGTVAYMSPEQGRGEKVDHRSDLFSLGVMLYRLSTGKMPFNGASAMALLTSLAIDTPTPPGVLNPQLPAKLDAVITKLLAKNPNERYQTADDAAEALLDAGRRDPTMERPALVAMPLVVGAQTQSVWEGIEISESVAVPLAERAEEDDDDDDDSAPVTRARPAASKLPLFAAAAALVLAAVAVGATAALWPKKKSEAAQVEPDKPVPPEQKGAPKVAPDPDRKVATWAIKQGGLVTVVVGDKRHELRKDAPVPDSPFLVEALDLSGIKAVADDDLKPLGDLKSLVELDLSGTAVTDSGLAHVARCIKLRWLALARTNIHDAGIAELKPCKDLAYLDLSYTTEKLSIKAFNAMEDCDKLEVFDLRGASIGKQGHAQMNSTRRELITNPHGLALELVRAVDGDGKYTEPGGKYGGPELTHVTLHTAGKPRDKVMAAIAALSRCRGLVGLELTGPYITDGQLEHFRRFRNLTQLTLTDTAISDNGLANFADCSRLAALNLRNTKVTGEVLPLLGVALTALDVRGTQVDAKRVAALRRLLSKCKIEADDPDADRAAAQAVMVLGGKIEGGLLPQGSFRVTAIFSEGAPLTDETLSRFAGIKTLRWANLSGTKVTDACLVYLKESKGMTGLLLGNTKVADAGLVHLKEITGLQGLQLDGTAVTDAGLDALKECKSLINLGLRGTKVTAAKVAELQKALPKCKIESDAMDRKVAEWVLSVGGIVAVNGAPDYIQDPAKLPKEPFRLTSVHMSDKPLVTDADLAQLYGCPAVTSIFLINCPAVTDAGLAHLGRDNLTELGLNWCMRVTDAGLAHFKGCKKLTWLSVAHCAVTDAGLAHFNGCTTIENLNLGYCPKVTDKGLANFKGAAAVKYLFLEGCAEVTDLGLANFKDSRGLDVLTLSGCPKVTDAGLAPFKECKGLKKVSLQNTAVTDAGLAHLVGNPFEELDLRGTKVTAAKVAELRKALPKCKIEYEATSADRAAAEWVLSVGGKVNVNDDAKTFIAAAADLPKGDLKLTGVSLLDNKHATDANLARFAQCPNIISLNLAGAPVTDAGLAAFAHLDKLEVLYLDRTAVGDAGAAHFKNGKQLRRLGVFGSKVADAGLAHFKDCKELSYLHIADIDVSDVGLAHFKDCGKLTSVYLNSKKVTDVGLAIFKEHKAIWLLVLDGTSVSDAGLEHLTGCARLATLGLKNTKVTAKGAGELAKALPKCKITWDSGVIDPAKK